MIQSGANLKDAYKEADRLGVPYGYIRRTGEVRFRFPDGTTIKVNSRRKDAPRDLTTKLRKIRTDPQD